MAFFARDEYEALAGQTDFTITFDYVSESDIYAYVNGILVTTWTLATSSTLRFDAGLAAGNVVVLVRRTSHNIRMVDWANASVITEADLDGDSLQGFFMAQEAIDIASTALPLGADTHWDAGGNLIRNVGTPLIGTDATTKAYVDSLTTVAGNVIAPEAGDEGLPLVAVGGGWDWARIAPAAIDGPAHVDSLLQSATQADARSAIGLGNVATRNTGYVDGTVPLIGVGNELPTGLKGTYLDLSDQAYRWQLPLRSGNLNTAGQWTDIEATAFADYEVLLVEAKCGTTNPTYHASFQVKIGSSWYTGATDYCYTGFVVFYAGGTGAFNAAGAALCGLHKADTVFAGSPLCTLRMFIFNGNTGWTSGEFPHFTWTLTGYTSASTGAIHAYGSGLLRTAGSITGIRIGTNNSGAYQPTGAKYRIFGLTPGAY
jgi:hypothetical protein